MRPIDADALIEKWQEDAEHMETEIFKLATYAAINDVKHAPTLVPERKKGTWRDFRVHGFVICPFCGTATTCEGDDDYLHFCCHCGADLRLEQNE